MKRSKSSPFAVLKGFSTQKPSDNAPSNNIDQDASQMTPEDDMLLFQQEISGVKKLSQDTQVPPPKTTAQRLKMQASTFPQTSAFRQTTTLPQKGTERTFHEAQNNEFYFSDEYVPVMQEGATRYKRDDLPSHELKRLRRGDYAPDVFLDLHGMTQANAKRELAALITFCIKENVACASVMHGIGKHILKERVPAWLAQHPDVLAFHQAPLEYGGKSALLVLFSILD